ncbi:MAG: 1-acyl-sn-glycerol-3-phosphate acyltransferase [Zoogloeaceae bacterium]|nr:1-acyl-sn-glycerol-3-phosphate acyltransferase [Zoogloeaceae bacterium]
MEARRRLRSAWSHRLLAALGVRLRVDGEPVVKGSLLVANHISWLDIFAIHALAPAAFVSKAEVRDWPLAGWLAARNETVFLRRGSRGHAKVVNGEIASILEKGGHVAVFPEGTTTDGRQVLHFHGALMQPALDAAHPVQPLALSYHDATGRQTTATAYVGETSFGESLAAILAERRLEVRIQVLPSHEAKPDTGRRALSNACRSDILAHLGQTG